ncbi:MAG: hypothetical protein ACK5OP_10180 [Sphingobacteriales bacterium]|jgi:hypothetical protein
MITDRIQLAGLEAYFQDPGTGTTNLGQVAPVSVKTNPLQKGKQLEISGIQLLIEADDLQPLFSYPSDETQQPASPVNAPLFQVIVMKEMFPGLFADPFSHRVHNIAGHLDFREGELINGRILEVDGIPVICSTGKEECIWKSRVYNFPSALSIVDVAWELASAKLAPPDSFHYKIEIILNDGTDTIVIANGGQMLKADAKRSIKGINKQNIRNFQILFKAKVFEDSYVSERSLPLVNENIGRPLLRAINLLEPIQSSFVFNSLTELINQCSDFHLFEMPGPEIKRLTATLDINAVLVNSPSQFIHPNNNPNDVANNIYHPNTEYEWIEFKLLQKVFTKLEVKRIGSEQLRVS